MKTNILSTLPHLDDVLSKSYKSLIFDALEVNRRTGTSPEHILSVYSSFLYAQGLKSYSGLKLFNTKDALQEHMQQFVGFLYQETELSTVTIYIKVDYLLKSFQYLSTITTLSSPKIQIHQHRITSDAEACIAAYQKIQTNCENLSVLDGWTIQSKEGKQIYLPLGFIHYHYGAEFTSIIHNALVNYGMTHKHTTLKSHLNSLFNMIKLWPEICPTLEELKESLTGRKVYHLFENVMLLGFAYNQARQNAGRVFFKSWQSHVAVYKSCFIDTGVFDAPYRSLLTPTWKEPGSIAPTFPTGGDFKKKEKKHWLVPVPLHIKDEVVVKIIQTKLDKDLDYIHAICMQKVSELETKFKYNSSLVGKGIANRVSPLDGVSKLLASTPNEMGIVNIENAIATFYKYGPVDKGGYAKFLGFQYIEDCYKELNLPTSNILMFLCSALVLEHPNITYGWLYNWQLFDKFGNQTGFKKTDALWVAVSWKGRKGASNAQQEVYLNEYSKRIVELIINLTDVPRVFLKRDDNDDYRYMLLKCGLNSAERISMNVLWSPQFTNTIANPDYLKNKFKRLPKNDAKELAELVTLKTLRKSKGLQIYLNTRKLEDVSEALGHKKVSWYLLDSYLPKPLIDYFNERWVRQFQIAILFEAMKDSTYLYEVIDIFPHHLDEFLNNHGLGALPELIDNGFNDRAVNSIEPNVDSLLNTEGIVLTISIGLLQVLIAIREYIESIDEDLKLKEVTKQWYEVALYILTTLDFETRSYSPEIRSMLNTAKAYPLDQSTLGNALLCSS